MSTVQNERNTSVRPSGDVTYGRPASTANEREFERSAKAVAGGFSFEWLAAGAGVVLTIIALADVLPFLLTQIVVIVLGAGLLIQGLTVAARARELPSETGGTPGALAGELTVEVAAGATGIVLGILSLVGLAPMTLATVATIAFGAALLLGGAETYRLNQFQLPWAPLSSPAEHTVQRTAKSSAGGEEMAGLAAIVLGILALVGMNPGVLVLVALLAMSSMMFISSLVTIAHMARLLHR